MTISRLSRPISSRAHAPKPPAVPASTGSPASPQAPVSQSDQPSAELITPAKAADLLSVTPKVLERWRGSGDGPAFVRLTSKTIRYRAEDIEAFVAGHIRTNTIAA
jgi:hypothetical protein